MCDTSAKTDDLVERIRDVVEHKGCLSDTTALRAADEIERLRALVVHYGGFAGCDMAEIRRMCRV